MLMPVFITWKKEKNLKVFFKIINEELLAKVEDVWLADTH